ncbi:MAG: hypothetical protein KBF99_00590 [Leptospiraceae bacterium]|nr:hypothetical protein [Leptospiraceae bacterium]MBK9503365.1 hypothetical protein [Leptospiraceae bacterium]MBP9161639.1 hypothetical protein [Leptospiraceae bacterium]
MKSLLLFLLLSLTISPDDNKMLEKYKKPLDASICKTKNFADCLAYKYIQHYHPNAKDADWYRNTAVTHYFDYKVMYQNEREKGEILFSFQSYSDGLEWNYYEDSVIIRIKEPVKLVDSNTTLKKINEKLESDFDEKFKIEKITKTISRNLRQSQPTPKEYYSIKEEIKYKVKVNSKNISFNGVGDKID